MKNPTEIERSIWNGLFGMVEMEDAAKVILAKSRNAGKWVPVHIDDFDTELERTGFVELIFRRWLAKGAGSDAAGMCRNGGFLPTSGFVERLVS